MKTKLILLFICTFLNIAIYGQENPKVQNEKIVSNEIVAEIAEKAIDSFTKKLEKKFDIEKKELLGTFELIKGNLDTVEVYKQKGIRADSSEKVIIIEEGTKTEQITKLFIQIKDGVIFHIKAFTNRKEHFYTNTSPTNIFSLDKENFIILRSNENSKNYIKLTDFLRYDYENGKNYIIENDNITLSSPDSLTHKVFINNNLKSIIDLRVYSDLLGLLDEASNGIVSFEGNSTFYLNPFSLGRFNYLFKKFNTGVSYSRFDNDNRSLQLPIEDTLNLIQKSFLKAGAEVDIFETRLGKKFPYKIILKAKGSLGLTEILAENTENKTTTTTLGLGFGGEIQVERFSNFGLNASVYINRYQNNNIIENDILNFNTISIHSEAYFYVPDSNDAFFLRLKYEQGSRNLSPSSNFFNIQFGYKAELNFKPKSKK